MYIRSVRSIGPPKSSAGHFDHFDVIGLETFVDRADAGHLRRCDGQLVGASAGASNCDEKYRYQANPKLKTKLSDLTHEHSPWPTERRPFATTTFAGAPSSPRRNLGAGTGPRLAPPLVDRHLAIVDPLFVHPLLAEPLLSGQRRRRIRRQACCVRRRQVKRPVLGGCRQR